MNKYQDKKKNWNEANRTKPTEKAYQLNAKCGSILLGFCVGCTATTNKELGISQQ